MAPGFFTSLSALALGLGGGSWTINLVKEAYRQSCESCPACPALECPPPEKCSPCGTGLEPVAGGLLVSPAYGALAVVVVVNLLLWAYWAGQSSAASTARRTERRADTFDCDDGPEYIRAARQRACSLRRGSRIASLEGHLVAGDYASGSGALEGALLGDLARP